MPMAKLMELRENTGPAHKKEALRALVPGVPYSVGRMLLPQKSGTIVGIGSVQGAVATWSNHGSKKSLGISHADH